VVIAIASRTNEQRALKPSMMRRSKPGTCRFELGGS